MARLNASQMTAEFGRPDKIRGVQVQDRLPWGPPRSSKGNVQVVLVHPLLVDMFLEGCLRASRASSWVPRRCDSHVVRAIRGFKKPSGWVIGMEGTSSHSWCTAWDFFATPYDIPPPGGVWTPDNGMPVEFARAFEAIGFTWGGDWSRTDLPHMEWRRSAPAPSFEAAVDSAGDINPADWLSSMLKQGDVGNDVWTLEFLLRAVGQKVEPDGIFGPDDKAAVEGVQRLANITVDGIAGPATERALLDLVTARMPSAVAIVEAAYQDVFERAPDAAGGAYWVGRISRDVHIDELWRTLWDSPEAKQRRAAAAAPAKSLPAPPGQTVVVKELSAEDRAALDAIDASARKIQDTLDRIG